MSEKAVFRQRRANVKLGRWRVYSGTLPRVMTPTPLFSSFMLRGLLICFRHLIPASGKIRKGGISLLNHEYDAWREFAQTKKCRSDADR